MGGINDPDDLSMKWILKATLRPPEFMSVANMFMYGNEQCTIIGDTEQELKDVARDTGITGSRLIKMTIEPR
jgi:hypothetical protein